MRCHDRGASLTLSLSALRPHSVLRMKSGWSRKYSHVKSWRVKIDMPAVEFILHASKLEAASGLEE
eukprot:920737-Rhodomonas_salina.2